MNICLYEKFQGLRLQPGIYTQKGNSKCPNAKRAPVGAEKVGIRKRSRVRGPEGTPRTLHISMALILHRWQYSRCLIRQLAPAGSDRSMLSS